jgi:hypothetical protein
MSFRIAIADRMSFNDVLARPLRLSRVERVPDGFFIEEILLPVAVEGNESLIVFAEDGPEDRGQLPHGPADLLRGEPFFFMTGLWQFLIDHC